MSIKSMTGFGRCESKVMEKLWVVELRCVNNRFLDVKMKLPRGYAAYEDRVRKLISAWHQRGRVDLVLTVGGELSDNSKVKVNLALARNYHLALQEISSTLQIPGDVTPGLIASYPDVLIREQESEDPEQVWAALESVLTEALQGCDRMRLEEGRILKEDLHARMQQFVMTVDTIEQSIPGLLQQRQRNLEERLEKLLGNVQLDPLRLAQEVCILADKTDVTEEIVRLRCHIKQLLSFLEEDVAVGRKLDFLIQEFLREVNTLASKINDASIAHMTVDLKSELEKMREQVQNIE
ncbi:MAG: YicC family protein [Desulfobulbaceae bacterium]|nr:MAG: YicC family protein [Desulfobulbaceae bacterium]